MELSEKLLKATKDEIKHQMDKRDMRLVSLADRIGKKPNALSKVLNGDSALKINDFYAIAEALHINATGLIQLIELRVMDPELKHDPFGARK